MPRSTHPPLKSYGLKRACIGPRASWAASCSSCLGTEAIRRGLKAAAAIVFGASDFAGVVLERLRIRSQRPGYMNDRTSHARRFVGDPVMFDSF